MNAENRPHTGEMIARFKEFYGFRFDTQMARKLKLSDGSAIGNWRRRDTIDLLLIAELCPEISLDWLIWGRGPSRPATSDQAGTDGSLVDGVSKREILHLVNEALEHYLHQPERIEGTVKTEEKAAEEIEEKMTEGEMEEKMAEREMEEEMKDPQQQEEKE